MWPHSEKVNSDPVVDGVDCRNIQTSHRKLSLTPTAHSTALFSFFVSILFIFRECARCGAFECHHHRRRRRLFLFSSWSLESRAAPNKIQCCVSESQNAKPYKFASQVRPFQCLISSFAVAFVFYVNKNPSIQCHCTVSLHAFSYNEQHGEFECIAESSGV